MFKVSAAAIDRFNQKRNELLASQNLDDWDQRETDDIKRGRFERLRQNALDNNFLTFVGAFSVVSGSEQAQAVANSQSASRTRPMSVRLANVANGSQPAVVKLTSYGSGARLGSMFNYISRDGELEVEDEKGNKHQGREVFGDIREDWQDLISNRTESRDIGTFSIEVANNGELSTQEAQNIINSAFGDRKYAFTVENDEKSNSSKVSGLVVLRSEQGERLTADAKAADLVQGRFDESDAGNDHAAKIRFHGHGNGIEYGRSRSEALFTNKEFFDHSGKTRELEDFNKNLTKEWKSSLETRKVRDVMHVLVSAKEGTDPKSFEKAAREFLGDTFGDHKYLFAIHDPVNDPKEAQEGGKRPHIHAHAIITMRSNVGERVAPTISTFKEWRESMAHHARENGIAMEVTDRREFASAPAFKQGDVKSDYSDRAGDKTAHKANSAASARRVRNKKINAIGITRSPVSKSYQAQAQAVWKSIKLASNDSNVVEYADIQTNRISLSERASEKLDGNVIDASHRFARKEDLMSELNLEEVPEFNHQANLAIEAIERNQSVGQDLKDETIDSIRDVVEATREHAQLRQEVRDNLTDEERDQYDDLTKAQDEAFNAAIASGVDPREDDAVNEADKNLAELESEAIERIEKLISNSIETTGSVPGNDNSASAEQEFEDNENIDQNEDIRNIEEFEAFADSQDQQLERARQLELTKLAQVSREQSRSNEREQSLDLDLEQ